MNIDNISKYGRSFSIIRIPYAFKLLMQELSTMSVQMRIITEDNIDQLTSMSFSDNVIKLSSNKVENQTAIQTDAPQTDAPQTDAPQTDAPQTDAPQTDASPDISNKIDPENLGWQYDKNDWDMGDIYKSIIITDEGQPSMYWFSNDSDSVIIQNHPRGWIKEDLVLSDGSILDDKDVIAS